MIDGKEAEPRQSLGSACQNKLTEKFVCRYGLAWVLLHPPALASDPILSRHWQKPFRTSHD